MFVTLIDGFLLHQVARPGNPGADAESLFETMRALFIAHAMDETQFEQRYRDRRRTSTVAVTLIPELAEGDGEFVRRSSGKNNFASASSRTSVTPGITDAS